MTAADEILAALPVDQVARQTGSSPEEVRTTAAAVLPALLGGLQANAAEPSGAGSLLEALGQHDDDLLAGGTDLSQVDEGDGRAIAQHIFGDQQDEVVNRLGGLPGVGGSGFGGALVQKLIPILAPMVLSWLANKVLRGGGAPSGGGSGGGGAGGGGGGLGDVLGDVLGGVASGRSGGSGGSAGSGGSGGPGGSGGSASLPGGAGGPGSLPGGGGTGGPASLPGGGGTGGPASLPGRGGTAGPGSLDDLLRDVLGSATGGSSSGSATGGSSSGSAEPGGASTSPPAGPSRGPSGGGLDPGSIIGDVLGGILGRGRR